MRLAFELVSGLATESPESVAVISGGVSVTYRELDARANQIANTLRDRGIGPEGTVGLLVNRDHELLAGMYGIWQAGGAYAPLDQDIPPDRLAYVLDLAKVDLVLCHPEYADRVARAGATPVTLDETRTAPTGAPGVTIDPDAIAYVIFTSGSTGRPKGVQISHRSLANLLYSMRRQYAVRPSHRFLASSSISFDVSGMELHLPLISGGTVLVTQSSQAKEGSEPVALIAAGEVTHVFATPSAWRVFLASGLPATAITAFVGGEELTPALAGDLNRRVGELHNLYGPTETTIWSTTWDATRPTDGIRIGRPIANTRVYVLDGMGRPVPRGVVGELFIGGDGVARGYVGRADLTAERFVPEPGATPGARMYATGDLARVQSDGTLECLGRNDFQVKIRGHRIELTEIESRLVEHPAVANAVVVARPDDAGDPTLVAYLIGAGLDGVDLRPSLREVLPAYMIPTAFVVLETMPLNAAGKVDRAALPAPDRDSMAGSHAFVEPDGATEVRLADLWKQALGIDRIGRSDRFFELGGDSIRVVRFLAAARTAGIALSLAEIYRYDTIATLAAFLDARPDTGPAPAPVTAPKGFRLPDPAAALAEHRIPGMSVAVVVDGEITTVAGYGTLAADYSPPVTPDTLFQVGSISKHVATVGALRLVSEGRLSLDEDINRYLTSWHLDYEGTSVPVTVRHLLANLSGLSDTPNQGFHRNDKRPTVLDLLRGTAGSPPVRIESVPGMVFHKNNTHFAVLQQILEDVSGAPFDDVMRDLVMRPVGMSHSSYRFDHPVLSGLPVAVGHDTDGVAIDGGWRDRSTQASGGLWTTAADLAKLALEIRRAFLGRYSEVLTPEVADAMLTISHPDGLFGLGTSVDRTATAVEFGHIGEAAGYRSATLMEAVGGNGVVVLTNSDNGKEAQRFVAAAVAEQTVVLGAGFSQAHDD
ncbi:amino acid adenylation domain-containing protein [Actinoplanes sp. HUAS TT8]|uniref:amino acid adenylation domain-containing protein n=1 Tax=Actinoplanes sp. HUAS TT8 TaxID=3447453 RepID=UPI003F5266B5